MDKEKKEIRLIELLNEYTRRFYKKYINGIFEEWWCEWEWVSERDVIDKEYGFIERLVDNDKINYEKLEIWLLRYGIPEDTVWFYEWLLMLLSISDEPIEFLLSILKYNDEQRPMLPA